MIREPIHIEAHAPFLFRPFDIGPLRLKNRIVALPVHTGFAHPDGQVSSLLIDYSRRLAQSGAAMVVTANAAVSPDGAVSRYNLRIDRDDFIPGLNRLAETIQKEGAVACLQLNHAGRFAKHHRPLLPSPLNTSNFTFNIASLKEYMHFFPFEKRFDLTRNFLSQVHAWRRGMDRTERDRVISDFSGAAVRACEAGFDMVELHGANGYLLCQFLSSFTNRRAAGPEDDFRRRTAFPLAVIRSIRQVLPKEFPIGYRLILNEWVPGGIDLVEALRFARLLEAERIAYISASCGTYNSIFSETVMKKMARPAYLREDVAALKKAVGTPTIISGRIITPSIADKLIQEGVTDLVGLGRPLLADLHWIEKARQKDQNIRACLNCHTCLKRVVLEQGITCSRWPAVFRERIDLEHKLLTRNRRGLWIVTRDRDRELYQAAWPFLVPDLGCEDGPVVITLLDFTERSNDGEIQELHEAPGERFDRWVRHRLREVGFSDGKVRSVTPKSGHDIENEVRRAVAGDRYGLIAMGPAPKRAWQRRILYRECGKVIGWIGTHERHEHVIVPIDFSGASVLAMKFLHGAVMKNPKITFSFCHVLTDSAGEYRKRWTDCKAIVGFDDPVPLTVLPFAGDVASVLICQIQSGNYGTVIMGKRGLSGIKRWLLGSVSRKVLKGLTDQSLFLIDW